MTGKEHTSQPSCVACDLEIDRRICLNKGGVSSKGRPTLSHEKVLIASNKEYDIAEIREFARQAFIQEAECHANRHQRP